MKQEIEKWINKVFFSDSRPSKYLYERIPSNLMDNEILEYKQNYNKELESILPELIECYNIEQNEYHNKDVFGHIIDVVDYVWLKTKPSYYNKLPELNTMFIEDQQDFLPLYLAALFHDIAKPVVKSIDEFGNIHFYKHEYYSSKIARRILIRWDYNKIDEVCFLIENHMYIKQWHIEKVKSKSFNKLINKCGNKDIYNKLMRLIDADNNSHATGVLNNQVHELNKKFSSINTE